LAQVLIVNMSFAFIQRVVDEVTPERTDPLTLKVDLKVHSNQDLVASLETIKQELESRKTCDVERVRKQLKHIDAELDEGKDISPLSLEHLELFQQFLARLDLPSLPEKERKHAEQLGKKLEKKTKEHPLAGLPRSGDTVDNPDGISYLKVPINRRRQMAVTLYLNLLTGPSLTIVSLVVLWYFVPYFTYVLLAYAGYTVIDNAIRPMPCKKRIIQKWRKSNFFKLFVDYYPIRIVRSDRTEDKKVKADNFDAKRHYLFCYHPHGVGSVGAFSFSSAAAGVDEMFPGLSFSLQTLTFNFNFPVTRDNLICLGLGDASKKCLTNIFTADPGDSAVLVTGGAKESMYAHPGDSTVVLKTRMGFAKLALTHGVSLVPVWGFGENNVYENLAKHSPTIQSVQRKLIKVLSFAPLLVAGRGVFSYGGGLVPHRRPITCVVGKPIHLKKEESFSDERLKEVHQQYMDSLTELFDTYKDIYDPRAEPIRFV